MWGAVKNEKVAKEVSVGPSKKMRCCVSFLCTFESVDPGEGQYWKYSGLGQKLIGKDRNRHKDMRQRKQKEQ